MQHRKSAIVAVGVFGLMLACGGLDSDLTATFEEVAEQIEAEQQAQQDNGGPATAPGEAIPGRAFHPMMPIDGFEGHTRTFTEEGEGTAEATYTKGDETVTVTVSDVRGNAKALERFAGATETVGSGYPVLDRGRNRSVMLVDSRFRVRIAAPHLDHDERKGWLKSIDTEQLKTLP